MELTPREREIVDLLRVDPLLTSEAIATRLSMTRSAVNVHLSNLGRKGAIIGRGYILRSRPTAVVVGGANMDVKARSTDPIEARTSNPGTTGTSPGGVGRNIAENLARLGTATHLVTAVGADPMGQQILAATEDAGVRTELVLRTAERTGTYTAVLDHAGELMVSVADMAATELVDPDLVERARPTLGSADMIVLDGNLRLDTLRAVMAIAEQRSIPVAVDPVSVAKARRVAEALDGRFRVHTVTPNVDELGALVGRKVRPGDDADLARATSELHARGVEHVWVRRGQDGSVLSSRPAGSDPSNGADALSTFTAPATTVADVTGAGDAMLAAYCHALLAGHSLDRAVVAGHAAAAATAASPHTVRPDLSQPIDLDRSPSQ